MKRFIFGLFCATASLFGANGLVVASGVTFEPGLPNNGGFATAFLSGLNLSGIIAAQGTPLPLSLAGVTVDVCGAPAPLYAVADLNGYQQINFQVPWESQFSFDGTYDRCIVTASQNGFQATQNAYVRRNVGADLFFYAGFRRHHAAWGGLLAGYPC